MGLIELPNTVILLEYGIGGILQIIALVIFLYLIYKSKFQHHFQLSPPIFLCICCNILQTCFGIIHFSYMTLLWRPDTVRYNAYVVHFSGTFTALGFMTNSICIMFLSIDRILLLILPIKYSYQKRYYASVIAFGFLICINFIVFIFDFIPDIPDTKKTDCRIFACMLVKSKALFYLNTRYCIAIINGIFAIFLGTLIRKTIHGNQNLSKANKIIFKLLIYGFIFDFFPHFCGFILQKTSTLEKIAPSALASGPHIILFGAVDTVICSILYLKANKALPKKILIKFNN